VPLPRIRFTVRRLMVLVAILGLVVGVIVLSERRRVWFRGLANEHLEKGLRYFVVLGGGDSEYQRKSLRLWEERYGAFVAHHGRLHDKYEWAARYPWLPVAADPPEPAAPPWPPTEWPE
jgi:hypothetical protein